MLNLNSSQLTQTPRSTRHGLLVLLISAGVLIMSGKSVVRADSDISLPTYQPGTMFVYSNGIWESVDAVNGDKVTWRNHRNHVSTGYRDFSIRRQQWETRTRRGTRQIRPRRDWFGKSSNTSLWPLAVGKKARYIETGRWQDKEGRWRTYRVQWRTEVAGRERIKAITGEFDTWKILAYRYSEGDVYGRPPRLREIRTWYYAPEVGHYIRYIKDYRGRKPTRSVDLVSIRPPVEHLKTAVKAAIDDNFQTALEKKHSGQSLGWELPSQLASGMTQPTATFRLAAKRYCRRYVQKLQIGNVDHTYFGVACRNRSGHWQIPGK